MNPNQVERIASSFVSSGGASRLSRRRALQVSAATVAATAIVGQRFGNHAAARQGTPSNPDDVQTSGQEVPELARFDRAMTELMASPGVPGGQLAVAKDGRLVFNRGYGLADIETGDAVQPDSLFRIASISKAFTAVGILSLVEEGTLTLNDRPLQILNFEPPANASIDPRLNDITLEHLLLHAGGWDIFSNFEPQGLPWAAMAGHVLGEPQPSSAETLIRFMLGFPLDFDPGTRSSYSNFGFNVLGRVIEQVTGQGYEEFTQQRILTPAGIERMRLGKTRREDRAPGEVNYYAPPGAPLLPSVFPGEGFTSLPYGAFYVESYDSHGGWIASAADLIRFATAVDGQRGDALLTPASVEAMLNTPRPSETVGGSRGSFGLGWEAAPTANGVEWSRDGGLPGSTAARLVKSPDGIAFAFIFNSLPLAWEEFFVDAETAIRGALTDVETWPEDDQFTD